MRVRVMKLTSVSAPSPPLPRLHLKLKPFNLITLKPFLSNSSPHQLKLKPVRHFFSVRSSKSSPVVDSDVETNQSQNVAVPTDSETEFNYVDEVRSPAVVPSDFGPPNLSLSDQAFILLLFISCTTTASLIGFLAAAIPTMSAMGKAAIALSKLADTAREEIPSTMAAIRLTSLEISDLTLELSDLSHEIADGVSKSTQAVQAADAGIRQIGSLAREQTMSMIEERANLPVISLQPVVAGAAKKTSRAVGRATRTFVNIISRRELSSDNEDASTLDSIEI